MPQPTITGILIDSDAIGTVPGQALYGAIDPFVLPGPVTSRGTNVGPIEVYVEVEDYLEVYPGDVPPYVDDMVNPEDLRPPQEEPCPPPEIITPSALMGIPRTVGPPSTSGFSWYSDDCEECCNPITDKIINYLDLKVATFTSPAYSPRLAASCNPDPIVKEAVARGHAVVRTIDLRSHMAGTLDRVPTRRRKDGTKVYKFRYGASFPKPNGPLNHLEVVSLTKIDSQKILISTLLERFKGTPLLKL